MSRKSLQITAIAKRLLITYVLGKFRIAKTIADSFSVGESISVGLNKIKENIAAVTEQITQRVFGKNIQEAPSVSEQSQISLAKPQSDSTNASEVHTKELSKVFSEDLSATDDLNGTATPLDDQEFSVGKFFVQGVGASEVFAREVTYNRSFNDQSGVSEQHSNGIQKVFSDQVSAAENVFVSRARFNVDTSGVTEQYVATFAKNIFELPQVADQPIVTIGKIQSENPSVADQDVLTFGKIEQEPLSVSELAIFVLGKPLANSGFASESISLGLAKDFDNSSIVVDVQSLQIGKENSDTALVNESNVISFESAKSNLALASEAISLNLNRSLTDSSQASESNILNLSKRFTDGGITGDLPVKSIGQTFTDASSANGDGSLRSQGYCDFDYFAEDYVGQSRTFT